MKSTLTVRLLRTAAVAVAYYALGRLGLSISVLQVTPVWPPSGIALAAVLVWGSEVWPGIWLGSLLVNFSNKFDYTHIVLSSFATIGAATGSTFAALLGGKLLNRFGEGIRTLDQARGAFRFLVFGVILSTLVAASIGTLSLQLTKAISYSLFWKIWFTWWMGDMAGVLVVTPLLLAFYNNRKIEFRPAQILETLFLVLVVLLVTVFAFGAMLPSQYHLEYMLIPCLAWAAFRFGQRGATLLTAVVSATAISATIHGAGAFVTGSYNESLLALQAFMDVTAMTTLILSAVLLEREHRTAALVRAMKDAQEAQAEAAEANRTKSAFLANMSHELRTPLNHIIGYSDLLAEEAGDDRELMPDIRKINQAGKHLLGMVSEILDLSMLETGKLELTPNAFHIGALVNDLKTSFESAAQKNNNKATIQMSSDPGTMVADETRVRQVLWCILDNACKFTKDGSISLDVSRENVGGRTVVKFIVADTGIGMPDEQMEKLFRPFSQGSIGTTKNYGGTGLGLAISKLFCDRMGGTIEVASAPGHGSTFTVTLPVA